MVRRAGLLLILFLILAITPLTVIRADATFVVNTTADEDNSGPNCSLREAITAANSNADYGGCTGSGPGAHTITFDNNVFDTAQTITLTSALPDITSSVTISGPGANLLTVSGANQYRPFHIIGQSAVTISGMTITQGYAVSGGAIHLDDGALTLGNVVVSNSHATIYGGGVLNQNFDNVEATGTLRILNSTFSGNSASQGGAVLSFGTLIVSNSTFSGNSADYGGAVYSDHGSVGLFSVTISGNTATSVGGGVYAGSGTLTLRNTIVANSTNGDCGVGPTVTAVSIQYSLIADGTCDVVNGQNGNRTGDPMLTALGDNGGTTQTFVPKLGGPAFNTGDNASLKEATLNIDLNGDGDTADTLDYDQRGAGYPRIQYSTVDMGAVEKLQFTQLMVDTTSDNDLSDCTDQPNDCSLRGAISLANAFSGAHTITFDSTVFASPQTITLTSALPALSGTLTIDGGTAGRVTLSGNHLSNRVLVIPSGAVVTLQHLAVSNGDDGGIINSGTLTLNDMTVSGNTSTHLGGGIQNNGVLTVMYSTLSGNTTLDQGGGIYNGSKMWLLNSTITGNTAQIAGGVFNNNNTGIIVNTTISGNLSTNMVGGLRNTGTLTLVNSTVSNNHSFNNAGGIENLQGTLKLYNTVVANNYLTGQYAGDSQRDVECGNVALVWAYNSLVKDGTCLKNGTGNLTGDPLLQPLGDNGGLTQTQLPLPASPVVNAGNNSYLKEATLNLDLNGDGDKLDTISTDQWGAGYPRVQYTTVDIGAVEVSTPFTGLVVDTTSDMDLRQCTAAANDCSLRGAINLANVLSGARTITFDSTVFASPQTITLFSALPALSGKVTIDGGTAGRVTLSGNHLSNPVLVIPSGAVVTLRNLTVSDGGDGGINNSGTVTLDGLTVSNNSSLSQGGGILNNGMMWLLNSTLTGNSAQFGGGMRNGATGIVVNTTISGNSATNQVGGLRNLGTLTLVNSTVSNNSAFYAYGGIEIAASVSTTLNLYNTIVANNYVTGSNAGDATYDVDCYNNNIPGAVTVNYSLVRSGNCNVSNGVNGNLTGDPLLQPLANNGGLTQTFLPLPASPVVNAGNNSYLKEATLNLDLNGDKDKLDTLSTDQRGAGYARVRAGTVDMGAVEVPAPFTGLVVDTTSDADLQGCSADANDCSLRGAINLANTLGGAQTITFDSSVFSTAQTITLTSALPYLSGTVTIDGGTAGRVTISGNHLNSRVFIVPIGAVVKLRNLTVSDGGVGGIFNGGTLTLDGLTVSNNSTSSGDGGGILNNGVMWLLNSTITGNSAQFSGGFRNNGTAIVVNSTISGNSATYEVGGLRNANTMTLINSTVSNNSAVYYSGGIEVSPFSTLKMYNTIVANNYLVGTYAGDQVRDIECRNLASVQAYNSLVKDGTCLNNGTGNRTGDPLLGSLGDNGGSTLTSLPQPSSPVINAGDSNSLSEATLNLDLNGDGDTADTFDTDQRGAGYTRINGSTVDMGAVEVHTVPTNTVPPINYHPSSVVTLTWSSLSWATGYEVQVSLDKAFTQLQCGGTLQAGASLSIDTCQLDAGTYYWRVRGKSASQTNATWSTPDTFVIAIP
jgi:CSLREA domain-containing protein